MQYARETRKHLPFSSKNLLPLHIKYTYIIAHSHSHVKHHERHSQTHTHTHSLKIIIYAVHKTISYLYLHVVNVNNVGFSLPIRCAQHPPFISFHRVLPCFLLLNFYRFVFYHYFRSLVGRSQRFAALSKCSKQLSKRVRKKRKERESRSLCLWTRMCMYSYLRLDHKSAERCYSVIKNDNTLGWRARITCINTNTFLASHSRQTHTQKQHMNTKKNK